MMRELLFQFSLWNRIQTTVLCPQARVSDISRGFDLQMSELVNQRPENENFFRKNFVQFSDPYDLKAYWCHDRQAQN